MSGSTRRGAWAIQAWGVFHATRRARQRDRTAVVVAGIVLVAEAALVAVFGIVAEEAGPALDRSVLLILPVAAVAWIAIAQWAGLSALETDLLRDMEQGNLDALVPTPLPASALVAGKLGHALFAHARLIVLLLPLLATAWSLGGLTLGQVALLLLAVQAPFALCCAAVVASAMHAAGRRRQGARGATRRMAVLFIVLSVVAGLALTPLYGGAAAAGRDEATAPLLVGMTALPAPALAAMLLPWVNVAVFGVQVPLWAMGTLLAAAWLPLLVATACHRWKPRSDATGTDLRIGFIVAMTAILVLATAFIRSDPDAAAHLHQTFAILLLAALPPWACASELSALAERRRGGVGRFSLLLMGRPSALAYCLVLASALIGLGALVAPVAWGTRLPLALIDTAVMLPVTWVACLLARVRQPSRPVSVLLACGLLGGGLVLAFLPVLVTSQPLLAISQGDVIFHVAECLAWASPLQLLGNARLAVRGGNLEAWVALAVGTGIACVAGVVITAVRRWLATSARRRPLGTARPPGPAAPALRQ